MIDSDILPQPDTTARPPLLSSPARAWTLLLLVFLAVHLAALFTPSLLDDADATHASAAQHMAVSGDWVTLYVNGIRYLEKPPLPYWMVAVDYHLFGYNTFAAHLPMTLGVLACAILAWFWARRAYGDRAAFYAAMAVLTSLGIFLYTRFFIPESLLTFFLGLALYCFFTGLEDRKPARFYIAYASLAIALLAKGLIAPVFFGAALVPYLLITGDWRRWREFRLLTGLLLFLAIGAPWHILAGLRNPDHGNPVGNVPTPGHVHGFFYFYFINEHFLRFLGKRYPHDYNKQPGFVYWLGQLIWLFPWSLYLPAALRRAWSNRHIFASDLRYDSTNTIQYLDPKLSAFEASTMAARLRFRARTGLLLSLYVGFILIFFSISTNQEYYTFPAWFGLLVLVAGSLASIEEAPENISGQPGRFIRVTASSRWLTWAQGLFALVGIAAAAALGYGLWTSRHLPFVSDIGTLMAHRAVGDYSLSMSHFFDLTGPSFAALRLPAVIAAVVLLVGPLVAWGLRRRGHSFESTISVAFTASLFLIAAHIAFVRFEPMLSSRAMADTINRITALPGEANAQLILYGDQSDGSSVVFYTHRQALLVHGQTGYFEPDPEHNGKSPDLYGSSMIWGSDYPDAPHIFLDDADLLAMWDTGPRKFLFVTADFNDHVEALLKGRLYKVQELSDKTLYTNKPL
jgi:4-amino-4-deoxy-L-arabinose transferase-like glycosyltransferase